MATSNKYDRQLRLWGANGQKALSESCIVLINATAVGTETLKNLVLPGIGSFHIIDDQQCAPPSPSSLSCASSEPFSNFFVFQNGHHGDHNGTNGGSGSGSGSGSSRAEIAMKHLSELNPDVKGSFTSVDSLETADYSAIFAAISKVNKNILVIAADLPPTISRNIASLCWNGLSLPNHSNAINACASSSPIPLILVKSYGLIGSVRIQIPHHPIIESKPMNKVSDLQLTTSRAARTFPELYALVDAVDLDSLDSQQHGHVPYVIILLKAMQKWQSDNCNHDMEEDRLPNTFEEKEGFKRVIKSMARNWNHEVNFQEAHADAYLAYTTKSIPDEVQPLLDAAEETMANYSSGNGNRATVSSFDVLLLALKKFMVRHGGCPPIDGSIPDMTSSTLSYIQLQGIYKAKAESDKAEMRSIITGIAEEYGSGSGSGNGGGNTIPNVADDELATFCKNIFNIRLIKTRSYEQEYNFEYNGDEEKNDLLDDFAALTYDPYEVPEHTPLLWHIALRACDAFYDEHGYYPGQDSREMVLESDAAAVQTHIVDIVKKLGLEENELIQSTLLSTADADDGDDGAVKKLVFAKEMTRYQNAEIHNIASVVGGVASQEAVKLITGQYVPMDGNYLFNGIVGVAGVCKL